MIIRRYPTPHLRRLSQPGGIPPLAVCEHRRAPRLPRKRTYAVGDQVTPGGVLGVALGAARRVEVERVDRTCGTGGVGGGCLRPLNVDVANTTHNGAISIYRALP